MPARAYRVRGPEDQVPTNYDPETRVYTGIWDGTFKTAWHNNPAWVFYDLVVNNRYGIGEFIRRRLIDKWTLYAIGQYCDELVPSGFKAPTDVRHHGAALRLQRRHQQPAGGLQGASERRGGIPRHGLLVARARSSPPPTCRRTR
jgi:hypothetical protein